MIAYMGSQAYNVQPEMQKTRILFFVLNLQSFRVQLASHDFMMELAVRRVNSTTDPADKSLSYRIYTLDNSYPMDNFIQPSYNRALKANCLLLGCVTRRQNITKYDCCSKPLTNNNHFQKSFS